MKKFRNVLATGMIAMMCLTACGSSASGSGSAANASAGSASTAKGSSAYDICYVLPPPREAAHMISATSPLWKMNGCRNCLKT